MGDIFSTSPVRSAFFMSASSTVRFIPAPAMEHCVRRGSCSINLVSSPMASGVVAASHFFRNSRSLLQNAASVTYSLSKGWRRQRCTGSSPMKNLRRPPAGSTVFASLVSAIALILLAQLELGGRFAALRARDREQRSHTDEALSQQLLSYRTAAKTNRCGCWRRICQRPWSLPGGPPAPAFGAKVWISGMGERWWSPREASLCILAPRGGSPP